MAASTRETLPPDRVTYQDVLDAPAHQVAEIVDGTLHTHPRPAMPHARQARSWVERSELPTMTRSAVRAGGGSSTSRSSTSARKSWSPTSRAGAARGCRRTPTPPT